MEEVMLGLPPRDHSSAAINGPGASRFYQLVASPTGRFVYQFVRDTTDDHGVGIFALNGAVLSSVVRLIAGSRLRTDSQRHQQFPFVLRLALPWHGLHKRHPAEREVASNA